MMQAQTTDECLTTWCNGKAGHDGPHDKYGFDDMRVGDLVRVTGLSGQSMTGEVTHAGYGKQPQISCLGSDFAVFREHKIELIERSIPALPDRPGTVGIATVQGRRVRVMRCQAIDGNYWAVAHPMPTGQRTFRDSELTDFERLDVINPETGKLA